MKFNVNDIVLCIDNFDQNYNLTYGKEYKVYNIMGEKIEVLSNNGTIKPFYSYRFRLVDDIKLPEWF